MGVLYAVNYDRRIPGAIIDLGLLFFSAGVSILFIPLGIGAGLLLAAIIHFVWSRVIGRTNP
jgi:cytochrome c biogenesis protein CcdA